LAPSRTRSPIESPPRGANRGTEHVMFESWWAHHFELFSQVIPKLSFRKVNWCVILTGYANRQGKCFCFKKTRQKL